MKIFYTENAGVYVCTEQTSLLIDGVHGGASVGFSPMPETEIQQIEAREGIFSRLDGLLFTHLHIDHFKAKHVTAMLQRYPDLAIWGPGLERRHLHDFETDGEDVRFRIGDFFVEGYRTDHSGKPYQKEPHFSFLLRDTVTQEKLFIAGDAVFYPEMAERILQEQGRIDLAFIMIYQLMEESSIRFLKDLNPGRILLYHNPDPEEDTNGLLPMVRQALRHDPLGRAMEIPEKRTWIREE